MSVASVFDNRKRPSDVKKVCQHSEKTQIYVILCQTGGHTGKMPLTQAGYTYFTFRSRCCRSIDALSFGPIQFCWAFLCFLCRGWRLLLGFRSRRLPISALLFKMLLFRLFLLLWRTSVAFTFKISYTRKNRTPINDYIHQSAGCHSAPTVFTVYQMKKKVSADLMIFCVLRGNSSSYFLNNKINAIYAMTFLNAPTTTAL